MASKTARERYAKKNETEELKRAFNIIDMCEGLGRPGTHARAQRPRLFARLRVIARSALSCWGPGRRQAPRVANRRAVPSRALFPQKEGRAGGRG